MSTTAPDPQPATALAEANRAPREAAGGAPEERGVFVAFEGGDGAGKSTQVRLLAERLTSAGHPVLMTREPGGTPVGERLRGLVLEHGGAVVDPRTEALIFAAARAAHVDQVIRPALAAGRAVVTDRFVDSSIAYQGAGRGLGTDDVEAINTWATGNLRPDLTVLLDVDPAAGRERRTGRAAEDRLEAEPDAFHTLIRQTFLHRAAADPGRYLVLDATLAVPVIAERVATAVLALADGSLPRLPASTAADRAADTARDRADDAAPARAGDAGPARPTGSGGCRHSRPADPTTGRSDGTGDAPGPRDPAAVEDRPVHLAARR